MRRIPARNKAIYNHCIENEDKNVGQIIGYTYFDVNTRSLTQRRTRAQIITTKGRKAEDEKVNSRNDR